MLDRKLAVFALLATTMPLGPPISAMDEPIVSVAGVDVMLTDITQPVVTQFVPTPLPVMPKRKGEIWKGSRAGRFLKRSLSDERRCAHDKRFHRQNVPTQGKAGSLLRSGNNLLMAKASGVIA